MMRRRATILPLWSALLARMASTAAMEQLNRPLPGPAPRRGLVARLAAFSRYGIFCLRRHTVLGDGALRQMKPRALHGIL